jgi:hypothetical protein
LAVAGEVAVRAKEGEVERESVALGSFSDELTDAEPWGEVVSVAPKFADSRQRRRVVPVTLSRSTETSRASSLSLDAKTIVAPSQEPSG